nr:hypothetical protein [Mechercharimyces sp. CAU 1602]
MIGVITVEFAGKRRMEINLPPLKGLVVAELNFTFARGMGEGERSGEVLVEEIWEDVICLPVGRALNNILAVIG